jgi:hypothetical protein
MTEPLKVNMEDVEELVSFFMNAPIDKPFSKNVMLMAMSRRSLQRTRFSHARGPWQVGPRGVGSVGD